MQVHYWKNVLEILRNTIGAEVFVTSVPPCVSPSFHPLFPCSCRANRTALIVERAQELDRARPRREPHGALDGRARLPVPDLQGPARGIHPALAHDHLDSAPREPVHGLVCRECIRRVLHARAHAPAGEHRARTRDRGGQEVGRGGRRGRGARLDTTGRRGGGGQRRRGFARVLARLAPGVADVVPTLDRRLARVRQPHDGLPLRPVQRGHPGRPARALLLRRGPRAERERLAPALAAQARARRRREARARGRRRRGRPARGGRRGVGE
jgi:hypothetical protein